MVNTASAEATYRSVLNTILDWSKTRPQWQRVALRRILQSDDVSDNDIQELVSILKSEKENPIVEYSGKVLREEDLPANPAIAESVNITNLSNVQHVNNLADNQEVKFSEKGITVVFGGNGTGKSGYTRILKNACRARHRDHILPDIHTPEHKDATPTADIGFSTSTKQDATLNWSDSDTPHNVLSAVSVFDRKCAAVHIQRKGNEIAFRPQGLDIPDTLVSVCKRVEQALASELDALQKVRNDIFHKPPWNSGTAVGQFAAAVSKDTSVNKVDEVCAFSKSDEERLRHLTETLSKDIHQAAREQEIKADRLKRFKESVENEMGRLTKESLDTVLTQRKRVLDTRQAAQAAASMLIEGDVLPDIGGEAWKHLWEAARKYSKEVAYQEQPFPNIEDGAKCVLCQQELGDDAIRRMETFEAYVSGDLEKKAQEEREKFQMLRRDNPLSPIRFKSHQDILEDIHLSDPQLQKVVKRFLASVRLRQSTFRKIANDAQGVELFDYSPSPINDLDVLIQKHRKAAKELIESANKEGLAKLRSELAELQDRKAVSAHKGTFLNEIKRLKKISLLKECKKDTATRSITTLGNQIADDVITPKFKDRFQEELVGLVGNQVRVSIERSGGKYGSPIYTVGLLSSPSTDISTVLSEGEQTCVAIATFLTELATSSHHSALIFDDPVSSLDHKWRRKVAQRLADEAKTRQVIVFTHDLVFLNDIQDAASASGVEFSSRHLTRTPRLIGIVNDNLPWAGMRVEARIDALGKVARRLRDKRNDFTQEEYDEEAAKFYDHMRASWERALEEKGVAGVIVRHRDYINAKNINKISALDLAACEAWHEAWSRCCDYVAAHDPSRGRNQHLPEPHELLAECETLLKWVNSIKDSHKQIDNSAKNQTVQVAATN